jgi:hypothetical protein
MLVFAEKIVHTVGNAGAQQRGTLCASNTNTNTTCAPGGRATADKARL